MWKDVPRGARAGTAWIVALDASSSMGARYDDARRATVVLSSAAGRGDEPGAVVARASFDKGRFGGVLLKTPLPVVSLWFPTTKSDPRKDAGARTMMALANPALGGLFVVAPADDVVPIVIARARFDAMWVTRWKMPCPAATVEQSFTLAFADTTPAIAPDGTVQDVAFGAAPSEWPLDVGAIARGPFGPGDVFEVQGEYCWGSDARRVEAYFDAGAKTLDEVRSRGVRAEVVEVGATFARLRVPRGLGEGDARRARRRGDAADVGAGQRRDRDRGARR